MGGKKRVKKLTDRIFTFIALSNDQPVPSGEIMQRFGLSKQALHYHIKKLMGDDSIRQTFRDYCAFYEATERGKSTRVKKTSLGLGGQLFGLHNIAFKFKILSGKKFKLKKTVHMQGWDKHHCFFDGCYVEQTTKNLIVVPFKKEERMYGTDPFELQERARDKAMSAAQRLADRHDLKLSMPEVCRKPHFAVQDPLTKYLRMEVTTDDAKIDDSEGTGGEIDFFRPEKAKAYLDLPNKMDRVEMNIEKMTSQMATYAEHLNAHIPVLKGMEKLIRKLDRRISQRRLGEFL